VRALESLRFASPATMLALDDAPAVFPWRERETASTSGN
jgi:hypothetical protein